eukprot:TRINITY_DN2165_c0_g1_i4.p1 TRINITY_DN2165_c0_g1~~TRINITY_DN2165_c0_g1_i4.p1  ORF type:complete len:299 (+),score=34.40 TRINITY_DN2165_c0_g1_i4:48-944(+)
MSRVINKLLVDGSLRTRNTVLSSTIANAKKDVIFFHGDVQDWAESMTTSEWKKYCLENTLKFLESKYSTANIFIVRAVRIIHELTEYDNFLRPGQCIMHMRTLLSNATHQLSKSSSGESKDLPIILLGFSKGVLILNHLVAELGTLLSSKKPSIIEDWQDPNYKVSLPHWEPSLRIKRTCTSSSCLVKDEVNIIKFLDKVEAIHWIDGHRFPTNPIVLEPFAKWTNRSTNNTKVFLHTSPRQIKDHRRKWIREEYEKFVECLKENKALLVEKHYFGDQPGSFESHFKVLEDFVTEDKS